MIVGSLLLILVAVAMLGLGLARGSNALLVGSIAASLLAAVALVVGARQAAAARGTLTEDAFDGLSDARSPARAENDTGSPARAENRAAENRAAENRAAADRPAREANRRRAAGTVYGRDTPDQAGYGRDTPDRAGAEPGVGLLADDRDLEEPDQVGSPDQDEGDRRRHVEAELDDDLDDGLDDGLDEGLDDGLDDEDPPDEPPAQIVPPADAARVARMPAPVRVIDGRPRYHKAGCVHLLGRESEPLPVSEAVELGFTPCSLCEPDSTLLADARRV